MWKLGIQVVMFTALSVIVADASTLAIVSADSAGSAAAARTALLATGKFEAIDLIDAYSSSPVLGSLSSYDAVLAYSNRQLLDSTGLGNVLAQYYSLGGKHLTLATYAFSGGPLQIGGDMGSGGYAAFTRGTAGDVSGALVATVPSDPIFVNIAMANVSYSHNGNFVHPGLASGATLLATDGSGVNMIARSANGVIDVNIYPGNAVVPGSASPETYKLLANTLTTPEPQLTILVFGVLLVGAQRLRRARR